MLFPDRVRHPANNRCRCRREANVFFWKLTESFALFKRWRWEKSPDTPTIGMLRDLAVRWARRTGQHSNKVNYGDTDRAEEKKTAGDGCGAGIRAAILARGPVCWDCWKQTCRYVPIMGR